MAYNDEYENRLRLQHFFFPGWLYFGIEAFLAIIVLILFNLSSIASSLLTNNVDNTNPIDFAGSGLSYLWHWVNQTEIFRHTSIFILWAIAGMLCYLLLFGFFKFVYSFIYSAEDVARLVKKHSAFGIFFWILTLNDLFKKILVLAIGIVLLLVSTFIFFTYAGNMLKIGIAETFPDMMLPVAISLGVAILGMRFFVSGIGLLVPSFRGWYYT